MADAEGEGERGPGRGQRTLHPPPGGCWHDGGLGTDPPSFKRGTTIGGWEIQRQVAGRPWPEAKAERGDGTLGRLMVIPAVQAPEPAALVAWRLALAPLSLDHPGLPPLRGVGYDPTAGVVWLARAWTPWPTFAQVIDGSTALPVGRRGQALLALGEVLGVLHRSGEVHGALAPARVLLSRTDGSACEVLDLGLATVAAGLGLDVPGVVPSGEGAPSASDDVRAFAAIVEAMLVTEAGDHGAWHPALTAWCQWMTSVPAADRPDIDDAVAALRELLPEPEPPPPPPPPILPPPPAELEIIERNERKREEEEAAYRAAQAQAQAQAQADQPVASIPATGPFAGIDVNTPFVPPIVRGGPGLKADAWPALVRARRAAAVFDYDVASGTITTGPVIWRLGFGQVAAAAEAIADALALAVDALDRSLARGPLDGELRACGFEAVDAWPDGGGGGRPSAPRPDSARWFHRPGMRVEIDGATITVQRECQAWVTSHELGTVGDVVTEVPTGKLPRAKAARAQLLAAMLAAAERVAECPTVSYVCRFCRGTFERLHFHDHLGACHGCSERYLHIVH